MENDDLRKELTDNILQITSSHLAALISNCKMNKMLVSLISSYQNSTLLFFRVKSSIFNYIFENFIFLKILGIFLILPFYEINIFILGYLYSIF